MKLTISLDWIDVTAFASRPSTPSNHGCLPKSCPRVARIPGNQLLRRRAHRLAAIRQRLASWTPSPTVLPICLPCVYKPAPRVVRLRRQICCSKQLASECLVVGNKPRPLGQLIVENRCVEEQQRFCCPQSFFKDPSIPFLQVDLHADCIGARELQRLASGFQSALRRYRHWRPETSNLTGRSMHQGFR